MWVLAFGVNSKALVRLVLAVLAAHAAHKALRPSPASQAADRLRAHRLAVLRVLVNGMKFPWR